MDYPQTFPMEAISVLLRKFRGETVSMDDVLHSIWEVVGWGLRQSRGMIPDRANCRAEAEYEAIVKSLEDCSAQGLTQGQEGHIVAIPWQLLLSRLFRWLADQLDQKVI